MLADAATLAKVPVEAKIADLWNALEIASLNIELLAKRSRLVEALALFGGWVPEFWVSRRVVRA